VGKLLEHQLRELVRSEVRTTILGHVQRGGTPTAYDRNLATAFGTYAASMVSGGQFGRMVALRDNRIRSVALADVAHKTRTVPLDAPMVAAALSVGTSFGVRGLEYRFNGKEISAVIA
jgi:6-phosphofructokinase 1